MQIRRFVVQGNKIRNVDDSSECMVNAATGLVEKFTSAGIDQIVAMCRSWITAVDDQQRIRMTLSDGQVLEGEFHEEWHDGSHLDRVGSLINLKSTSKQFARRVGHRLLSIIVVWDPEHSAVKLFEQLTLAFGQTVAVNGFCRTARCLKDSSICVLILPLTNFFDDFFRK